MLFPVESVLRFLLPGRDEHGRVDVEPALDRRLTRAHRQVRHLVHHLNISINTMREMTFVA